MSFEWGILAAHKLPKHSHLRWLPAKVGVWSLVHGWPCGTPRSVMRGERQVDRRALGMESTSLRLALSSVALLLVPVGCMTATSRILARQQTYVATEYAPYLARGTAELSGQAFVKDRGGEVIYGAEDSVYLFPATRYTDEWWQRTLMEGKYLSAPDPRSLAFMRTAVADERGRFRFRSLPAGKYYLVCTITWEREGRARSCRW